MFKLMRAKSFLLVLLISVSFCTPNSFAYRCGDVNNDTELDISDLVFFISYMFLEGDTPEIIESANINGTNLIDISDLIYLIANMFQSGPELLCQPLTSITFPIISTGVSQCYDSIIVISCPDSTNSFYGQAAQYENLSFSYMDNGNGIIIDNNTGLMWQQSPDLYNKLSFYDALAAADTFSLGGYTDWRLPSIKELYSLINFTGSGQTSTPYIDTSYFDFRFGDTTLGERTIDGQYWSSTEYVGLTMGGDPTVFGVNFADGRIKGYPREFPTGGDNYLFHRFVRGNTDYGINNYIDNSDGTITDNATGLMWQKTDDATARNWEDALSYAENLELASYSDWRLPNAKELQSIVDYTRAPDAQNALMIGMAIDPIFDITDDSWFWTNTTLLEAPIFLSYGSHAIYFSFGIAWGYMNGSWLNVHGAGAQRSDPKDGNPADYPFGFGPQGDEIRILNYVRCVRDVI